ncbi:MULTISPECIES: hypothetical protein [Mesorhizobium]|uniref:Uncharacterized protein n=1 Tax=Mesorhizobium japonicum R7A TaxID=935547 RepID=A0ABX6MPX5_9HYPH|nr:MULTISPECIES: hypothetical protein [Mesorhizobium]MBE1706360.1 hypothetical protein [Mesorhizobium japonicum]MBE1715129.1 hypothetical protein [Mesorhizobium japonicum]MUT21717.1 hypothetical protein [Mesorhizobium japonicum]MUT27568.1 hypothetical protein [Mesorhizobium japonicum]QJF01424.1 hypothetical protein R7A2020_11050 [Mesorhizobium japonicum R7A]
MPISPSIPIAILAIPLSNATLSDATAFARKWRLHHGRRSPAKLAHARASLWVNDRPGNEAYLRPVDAQIGRFLRRDALCVAARGAILQPSRFRAINSVFGHLRPGERNVLDDLSPIL